MPVFALLIGLLNGHKGDRFAKHMVFTLHFHSFALLAGLIPMLVSLFVKQINFVIEPLFILWVITYLTRAVIHVYEISLLPAITKVILICIVYMMIIGITMAGLLSINDKIT